MIDNGATVLRIVQPALPSYRVDLFSRLGDRLPGNMRLYYSAADLGALTQEQGGFPWAEMMGRMRSLPFGLQWQEGAARIPLTRGDTLVLSGNPRCLSTLVLLARASLRGVRTVWWSHYWSSSSKPHRFVFKLLLMRLCDEVLFYVDREIEDYRKTWIGLRDKRPLRALNNGINIDPVVSRRAPFDAAGRERAVLFIGRLTPKAGLELLVRALAQPAAAGVRVHVIGEGEEHAQIVHLAEQLGVAGQLVWHGASTDEKFISAIANRCRLFVYPGAVGLSLIHAMAYGLPCVVHDDRWGHMPEIAAFLPDQTGLAFRAGDAQSLAGVLGELIDDLPRLEAFSAAAARRVENHFNTSVMADRLFTLWNTTERVHKN